MLDIAFIRENPDVIKKAAADKLIPVDVDLLLALDFSLRDITAKTDAVRAERNRISKLIPKCIDNNEKQRLTEQVRVLKSELSELECTARKSRAQFDDLILRVPSVPAPEVPAGKGEEENTEIRRTGQVVSLIFNSVTMLSSAKFMICLMRSAV